MGSIFSMFLQIKPKFAHRIFRSCGIFVAVSRRNSWFSEEVRLCVLTVFCSVLLSAGASKRSRFPFGRSQWRTPFLFLFLFLPSDLLLFLRHSESGRSLLRTLHCLLLGLFPVANLAPDHTQPLVFAPPLRYYLRGSHQRRRLLGG